MIYITIEVIFMMYKYTLIADVGSTHMGKIDYAIEAIKQAKASGIDIVKFQMFKGEPYLSAGNIELPRSWWPTLLKTANEVGIKLTSSVFDEEAFNLVMETCDTIKLAYSQKHQLKWIEAALAAGKTTIVSCDVMTVKKVPKECVRLFCIPEYPVRYLIDFHGLFKGQWAKFNGFSDHTMGTHQTLEAVRQGAQWIEKHLTLDKPDIRCPDANFAIKPVDFAYLTKFKA